MSQAQAPKVPTNKWCDGWLDIDFYRIKLVVDRVDRTTGFWYYLTHLNQALRDFRLWLKFRKLVRVKPKTKPRAKTFFKWKKTKEEARKVKTEVVEVKEDVDLKLEEVLKSFGTYMTEADGYGEKKE